MGWPQITLMSLWLIGLGVYLARDGKPMVKADGRTPCVYSFWMRATTITIWCALLWAGGFFD